MNLRDRIREKSFIGKKPSIDPMKQLKMMQEVDSVKVVRVEDVEALLDEAEANLEKRLESAKVGRRLGVYEKWVEEVFRRPKEEGSR